MDFNTTHEHLKILEGSFLPPFCVEVFLTGGASYFVQTTLSWGKDSDDYAMLRVWDLRLLNAEDLNTLKKKMNETHNRSEYGAPWNFHPKLDVANLHVPKSHILYCVEWHDRDLPIALAQDRKRIGFSLD